MSTNKEILELIRQLNAGLGATIEEAVKNDSIAFFKESIKFSALSIFEKAQLLNENQKSSTVKAPIEIKIIKQQSEETVVTSIPVEEHKPEAKITISEPHPVIEKPKPVPPVIHPKVQEIEQPNITPTKNHTVSNEGEDTSLNAKIAKVPVVNVADKLKETPIKELVKAISISKKFEFINELFNGNADEYKKCLQTIESSHAYEEASAYITSNISNRFGWNEKDALAAEFFILIKRRFL